MKKLFFCLILLGIAFIALFAVNRPSSAQEEKTNDVSKSERVKRISLEILRRLLTARNSGATDDFKVLRVEVDDLGMAHTRVLQTIDGVPVWEGEAIVHLKADESLSTVTDKLKHSIIVNTKPILSPEDAARIAHDLYDGSSKQSGKQSVDMWIYRAEDRDHLVYRVETPRVDPINGAAIPIDFIDAHSGKRIFGYNNLQTGTGASLYSGTVSIGTSFGGGTFYMENLTRRVGTFNGNYGTSPSTSFYFADPNDIWDASIQRAGVDAQYGGEATMNYYQSVHNRNGINGVGGPGSFAAATNNSIGLISSFVHWGTTQPELINNAFWEPTGLYMAYNDGDGFTFTPLTTLDICGHEFTHGVTQFTANLNYSNESGALNESMSDVFGTMIERYVRPTTWNWRVGEDAYTPFTSGDALRYLDNPNLNGYPDHYSLRVTPEPCTPTQQNDYCGVHRNSSISNHAFYLIANGGTNRISGISVTGIGPDNAARIWYRALSFYMSRGTNFTDARMATLNAAADIFGSSSAQHNAVANGWCAVGIGSCAVTSCPTSTISVGQTVNGTLQAGDCLLPSDSSYYDRYTFTGTAGQQIFISMNSAQFDTFLFLIQGNYPGGTSIASDHNGGGGTNSRIPATSGLFTLPATGTYTILANSFNPGVSGTYSLTLGTGTSCTYSASPNVHNFGAFGGGGLITISAQSGCPWTVTSNVGWMTTTSNPSGTGNGSVTFTVFVNSGTAPRTGTLTVANQIVTVNQAGSSQPSAMGRHFDFDGDRKTDIGIFRPSNGQWWHLRSSDSASRAAQFGTSTDIRVPADFTGDGKVDTAFWRPSTGQWFVLRSENSSFYGFQFGQSGDIPVAGDFDRDNRADAAIYRPSNGGWYILLATGGVISQQFGIAEDKPVVADYDGDGKDDIAVFRPSSSQWWILKSAGGVIAAQFGASGDKIVPGDYTGDGKADIAFWRPSNGTWYILRSENSSFYGFPFGTSGDVPAPGDYDGDSKFDAAVFRPSNSAFYLQRSTSGFLAVGFGTNGDQPIAASFVR